MKLFRNALSFAMGAALLLASSADFAVQAQAPSITYTTPAQVKTYRATVINLTPAASATDFLTIGGVAGMQIHWIKCSGVSTANATALIQVIKRSTADTGGTSTTLTNVRLNANYAVAGATAKAYTVNPSGLGTAIGTVSAAYLATNTLATSSIENDQVFFDFSNQNLWLDAAATYVALNANAQSFTAGAAITCTIEWQEQ